MSCIGMEEIPGLADARALYIGYIIERQRDVSRLHARNISLKAELLRIRNMCRRTVVRHELYNVRRRLLNRYRTVLLSRRIPDTSLSAPPTHHEWQRWVRSYDTDE